MCYTWNKYCLNYVKGKPRNRMWNVLTTVITIPATSHVHNRPAREADDHWLHGRWGDQGWGAASYEVHGLEGEPAGNACVEERWALREHSSDNWPLNMW